MKSVIARFMTAGCAVSSGSSNTSSDGKRPGLYPVSVQAMSTMPSRTWFNSMGAWPPSCIPGYTSMRMRPSDSASIVSAHGTIIDQCPGAAGGSMW